MLWVFVLLAICGCSAKRWIIQTEWNSKPVGLTHEQDPIEINLNVEVATLLRRTLKTVLHTSGGISFVGIIAKWQSSNKVF